jgi:hypothetical protein
MNLRRIGTIGFATALLAGALAVVSPANAAWGPHRGHWGHGWHGPWRTGWRGPHVWVRPWGYYGPAPYYYAPPPVYYAPPVVYAPPPVYYPPALSIGVRIR